MGKENRTILGLTSTVPGSVTLALIQVLQELSRGSESYINLHHLYMLSFHLQRSVVSGNRQQSVRSSL